MKEDAIIMRSNNLTIILLLVPFFILSSDLYSQNQRPKIGLVLSGGGAKGIAHIGVLKAMEEAGLTPDYITGTSMGSIVGGLYAAGYSADELMEIVEDADWGQLLTNKIPLDKVTFEEKFYYGRYLLEFYLQDKKLQFPKGVIEGQALMELFSNLTRPVHDINDFNDLPIPFACVGADIVTGEPVILNKGSLAMSMRASMAIPSIFTPVKIDDHLLVDGGLVRNMPVPEVLDMGADIVIGVFVSSDLSSEEELNSAISILSQSAFLMSAFDSREQLNKCDILIEPDLKDFSTGSFNLASQILEKGLESGKEYYNIFKKLADSLNQIGPLHQIVKPTRVDKYVFKEIKVEGNNVIPDEFIIGKIGLGTGDTTEIEYIQRKLNIIYGTQYFERMWFEITDEDGSQILKIHVVERPNIQFRFSYHYDSENKGGIVGNVTLRNVLLNRSRLIFEADLATHPSIITDYFKYIGKHQNAALRASGYFTNNELPGYDSLGNQNVLFSSRISYGSVGFQSTRKQSSAAGLNIKWSNVLLKPKIADGLIKDISRIQYNSTSLNFFYQFNNFNDRYFPTKGLFVDFRGSSSIHTSGKITIADTLVLEGDLLDGFIETSDIYGGSLTLFPIIPLGQKFSFLWKSKLRLSNLSSNSLNLDEFDFIGGFTPGLVNSNEYYGSGIKEFSAANYFYTRISLQYKIKNSIYLQGHFNYLDSENIVTWIYPDAEITKLGDRYHRFAYGGSIGMSTPIGPVSFAFAKDHYRKGWKTSLIIGFYY